MRERVSVVSGTWILILDTRWPLGRARTEDRGSHKQPKIHPTRHRRYSYNIHSGTGLGAATWTSKAKQKPKPKTPQGGDLGLRSGLAASLRTADALVVDAVAAYITHASQACTRLSMLCHAGTGKPHLQATPVTVTKGCRAQTSQQPQCRRPGLLRIAREEGTRTKTLIACSTGLAPSFPAQDGLSLRSERGPPPSIERHAEQVTSCSPMPAPSLQAAPRDRRRSARPPRPASSRSTRSSKVLRGVGCLARTRQHRCSRLAARQAEDQPATRKTWWLLLTGAGPALRAQHLYLRAVSWLARDVVGLSGPTLRARKK